MADVEKKICEKFNLNNLTENQKLAISSLRENRDIFIGTKTGSGKLLTYQCVPIVYGENSVTVIIAPLISIMKEQVESLSSLGYRAVYIEGSTDVERVASGYYNLFLEALRSWLEKQSGGMHLRTQSSRKDIA
ncbi:uncharacterized protein LOC134260407 [Saccostrea cucullata]|uniref:uncharacterized protein LOC134234089 n=1 Tax=Saccostrea cuccullata TaxID=36930 RepID=UPI002ED57B63